MLVFTVSVDTARILQVFFELTKSDSWTFFIELHLIFVTFLEQVVVERSRVRAVEFHHRQVIIVSDRQTTFTRYLRTIAFYLDIAHSDLSLETIKYIFITIHNKLKVKIFK